MIATFYSFKGGVGRSMALVNVGEYLAREGVRVLLVDWDLEAPGLERYFAVDQNDVQGRAGVIDLVREYRTAMAGPGESTAIDRADRWDEGGSGTELSRTLGFRSPVDCLLDIGRTVGLPPGQLQLLPAGQRDGDRFASYAANVQTMDWGDLYRRWEGELYLEWFRAELLRDRDLVLVDSRTGVTEVGGVCVYQLADTVVLCCAPNDANLDGTERMARAFARDAVAQARPDRPLRVLPIPTRVPKVEQKELVNQFLNDFGDRLGGYYRALGLPADSEPRRLMVPQIPLYAFQERVAVREAERSLYRDDDLRDTYVRLAELLARLAPSDSRLQQWSARHGEVARIATAADDVERAERDVLTDVDRFIADVTKRRTGLQERLRRWRAFDTLAPLVALLAVLATHIGFGAVAEWPVRGTVAAVWMAATIIAVGCWLFPVVRADRLADLMTTELDVVVRTLAGERAAFLIRQGAYANRLDPAAELGQQVSAARQRLAESTARWDGVPQRARRARLP